MLKASIMNIYKFALIKGGDYLGLSQLREALIVYNRRANEFSASLNKIISETLNILNIGFKKRKK